MLDVAKQKALAKLWIGVQKTDGCWTRAGRLSDKGYSVVAVYISARKSKRFLAHRLAYEEARGPVPVGLELDHLCRNRACIRPDHLEPVTHAENMRRGKIAQKTSCKHGHPLPLDMKRNGYGRRVCQECLARYRAQWSRRNADSARVAGCERARRKRRLNMSLGLSATGRPIVSVARSNGARRRWKTPEQVRDGTAVELVKAALAAREV